MDTSGIYTLFTSLGFTIQDYLLITLCPLFAAIGSMVHAMLVEINPNKLPTSGRMREKNHAMATLKWLFYRIFIGAALGLILGLYFVGSLVESPNAIARIFALAVLLGYSAPKLWAMQEKHILEQMDKKIKVAIGESNPNKVVKAEK
ncbi:MULTISPECIES: hypothetical protein [Pseudoalteromonas]|uniref:hypothetical protein n=1 Tax=Pseudoalteromonas TaxID=53246 RepID=UPI000781E3E9|nr:MULTISPECIES: hypothetical protein [Pseudoalteromonas]MCH2089312.1 hypothetical protein [Pseudoalteromonas sp.]HCV02594.1 hypothetical protein [Pseudoalteromonas sp.]|tara:strand:- start:311 stop:751 length:441 start_codon:yes stop_codon:yes gene_type:complete